MDDQDQNKDNEVINDATPMPLLAIEDDNPNKPRPNKFRRVWQWLVDHKYVSISLLCVVLVLLILAVPFTRYNVAGSAIKKSTLLSIKDSVTNTPVSGAIVLVDNQKYVSDANGRIFVKSIKPGPKTIEVMKKYYKNFQTQTTIPLLKKSRPLNIALVATGRQTTVNVKNLISSAELANVSIKVADTISKTDAKGTATLVLPAGVSQQKASLQLKGYNTQEFTIKVSDKEVVQNTAYMVPSGKVYFFSNRSGKLNLLKSDLDGSNVQTVLGSTGFEDINSSSILQSPDWSYIGLVLRRNSSDELPELYILSTDDDKLISIESGNVRFYMYGWAGQRLIYSATRNDTTEWQAGHVKLKSYDATTGKITQLDQTLGSDPESKAVETYSQVLVSDSTVLYVKTWSGSNSGYADKLNSLQQIDANGANHKSISTYAVGTSAAVERKGVNSYYVSVSDQTTTYYELNNSDLKQISIKDSDFYSVPQNFMKSPSGQEYLWTDQRDGRPAIILADASGNGAHMLASYNDYYPYSWYGDDYILLTKANNEIYIISTNGTAAPRKLADYQYTFLLTQ